MALPPSPDVIVIGGGHAGAEAALAAARRGARVLLVTPALDRIGYMPCNPSIGGPAKGHLVAEIDALGGVMGVAADRTALQVRTLNTGKGPAVRALRAQCDKTLYALAIKDALETAEGVTILQNDATGLVLGKGREPRVTGVETRTSGTIAAGAVVVTAGTFLRGRLVRGAERSAGGRAGERADESLAAGLATLGIRTRRFKTGTPPRIDARTVDFTAGTLQPGDSNDRHFSHDGRHGRADSLTLPPLPILARELPSASQVAGRDQLACLRVDTNPDTHAIIAANLHRAPMFDGTIEGVGPRYCPSIEDKVHRFGDKDAHPVFLEPEGWRTIELYVQGMSTSLPTDVQEAVIRTIPALRDARITRYGYAVEYDAVDAGELSVTLEARQVPGLFLAGQVNGTSGYEEAAAQGLVAGANAAARALGLPELRLGRADAYIGVMIDDLTTRPLDEPYRMLTSRAEHRLLLRTDTAPRRLTGVAASLGLLDERHVAEARAELAAEDEALSALRRATFSPRPDDEALLARHGVAAPSGPQSAHDLLRRPGVTLDQVDGALRERGVTTIAGLTRHVRERVEQAAAYEGFVARAEREAGRTRDLERLRIADGTDFAAVPGLRHEARQRLAVARPETIGQAGRLPGITPADVAALLVHSRRRSA